MKKLNISLLLTTVFAAASLNAGMFSMPSMNSDDDKNDTKKSSFMGMTMPDMPDMPNMNSDDDKNKSKKSSFMGMTMPDMPDMPKMDMPDMDMPDMNSDDKKDKK